jgi:hypothetical protein
MLNDESSDDDLRPASEFRRVCVWYIILCRQASVSKMICGSIMEKRSTLLVLQLPMQQLVITVIVLMIATSTRFFVSAGGGYTGDTQWTPGHATFYGGDDASGTQGELSLSVCLSFNNCVCCQLSVAPGYIFEDAGIFMAMNF